MEYLKGIFELAKASPMKLVLILAIISAASGFVVWYHGTVEEAGYNSCLVDQQKANEALESEQLEKLKAEIAKLKADKAKKEKAAQEAADTVADFKQKNQGLLDEILELSKKADACVFSDDFGGLLFDIIGQAPSISKGD
jgi:ABC-type transporter MlaC component